MSTEKQKYYVKTFLGLARIIFCTNRYLLFLRDKLLEMTLSKTTQSRKRIRKDNNLMRTRK